MLNKFKTSLVKALKLNDDWKSLREAWISNNFPLKISGAKGPWAVAILANLAALSKGSMLIVTPDDNSAQILTRDLNAFCDDVHQFPWWGTMLYRGISPQASVFGRRATILAEMAVKVGKPLIVASLRAALGYVPPPEEIVHSVIQMRPGDQLNPADIEIKLANFGYSRVARVSVPGEFALRGEVLDVYPLGNEQAIRVVFSWDEIEEIKSFNPFTQISSTELEYVIFHPLRELIWTADKIERLKLHVAEEDCATILDPLETDGRFRSEELFYPLVFNGSATLTDYLGDEGTVVFMDVERLTISEMSMLKEHDELYSRAKVERHSNPKPNTLVTSLESMLHFGRQVEFCGLSTEQGERSYRLAGEPGRSFFGNIAFLKEELSALVADGYAAFVFAESESQAQRIAYLLREIDGLEVGAATISEGFTLPHAKIIVISESEIFGRRTKAPDSVHKAQSEIIETFIDLTPGDFVVHVNYGIGRFKGIERIKAAGAERDYIELEYAGEETVFIPIEQVNLIQRYIGQDDRPPRPDRLGGLGWEKKKNRVRKSVEELAERLISLYARRQTATGFTFPKDDDFQVSFEADFPWQETPDQLLAIADVKSDMERPKPMDRLICGDVGYGKTEIAMRAAFKAIMGGRQVAYLCPTTILAEQHHESFSERFKRLPVTIGMLSRFVAAAERREVIRGLAEGRVDIVIGTHRILSKDVNFKNLGLIIIDEEQRFGVKDKERLKECKASVDCLTLSATPIPRTLHMSLVKIRDMSLLRTAPRNRMPIETFIQGFDEELIAKAIRRELDRGGQVFFLHNRIESLEQIQLFLRNLIPEALIEIAHGRMLARALEDTMHRFVHGAFQVLVSTTIIENGIDIPNVNTIIIDRADMYGISQLYQLRGRVGRSGKLAYAYLFYPENLKISELAMKRLQAISDFTELGSGFKIAMKDMEVRGAGNLLGAQQKGDVFMVGFDLYLRLLEEAVQKRMDENANEGRCETYLELEYSGFIPDPYISDASEKMEVYKKIAAVSNDAELENLYSELHDRYGPLPDEVHSLISIAEIRIICWKLKVTSLKERRGITQISFGRVSMISADKVMKLIGTSTGQVKLNPAKPECLILETGQVGLKEKSAFIRERLEVLL